MHRNIYLLAVLIWTACTPPVVFDQPYPLHVVNEPIIPHSYQGSYICESDSALVLIDEATVTLRKEHYFKMPLSQLSERSDCSLEGNEMQITGREECIPVTFVNDSTVRGLVIDYDTLFAMVTDISVARMYKGNVVLSKEVKEGEWAVSMLSLQKSGDLVFKAITDKSNLAHVEKVTFTENITSPQDKKSRYKISPTMIEFERLLSDEQVFVECEYLTKVNVDE